MGTWLAIAALVFIGPMALKWWALRRARAHLERIPLFPCTFVPVEPHDVPAALREALDLAAAELTALGFEPCGYLGWPVFPQSPPRILAVLRNHAEGAFALIGFSLGTRRGADVEFETLFVDGAWLRSFNRRVAVRTERAGGRIVELAASSLAEQWRAHQGAVAAEPERAPREAGLAELISHRSAEDSESYIFGIEQGDFRRAEDGVSFRFTQAGSEAFINRHQEAVQRFAKLPPPTGALAMRLPADELERQFQDLEYLAAQQPKARHHWRGFLLSGLAFAASAYFFRDATWLLWTIPFLLFHELGHFVTMRLFGHRDATIRFVPFFGAATMTTTHFRKLSHEMIVLLAGPVPGILIGLAIFQLADFGSSRYLVGIAITLVSLNGLNLLPIYPLDGGRILHALVTAGRPRLALASKVVAGAVFVVLAIVFKDWTLLIIAAAGALVLRSGARQARAERAVRRHPDFAPGQPPEQRRRLIFEALAEHDASDGEAWRNNVKQLEVSLSHEPRWAPALPWLAVYGACLGGVVAFSLSVFSVGDKVNGECPERADSKRLSCAASASVSELDWSHPTSGSIKRNPFKLVSRNEYPTGAFVWCTRRSDAAPTEALANLRATISMNAFCTALPWESDAGSLTTERRNARWTLSVLSLGGIERRWRQLDERLDAIPEGIRKQPRFDQETVRLLRAAAGEWDSPPGRVLAERLGRSPTESCKRFKVLSVSEDVEAPPGEDEEEKEDGAGEKDVPAPATAPRDVVARIGVITKSPDDLAPLTSYLCQAGCDVQITPFGSMDPRLRVCFQRSDVP
jgi:Zn-dependent protease